MKHETDLAKLVIDWLLEQHWEIYQEVQFHQGSVIADIVAIRNNIMWIIECKTTYGFAVLQQATYWPVHYRSVAVPAERYGYRRDYQVAKNYYKVGVIEVYNKYDVNVREVIEAPLFVRNRDFVKEYLSRLSELHKTYAEAGSKGGQHLTPYKMTMMEVRKFIEHNPGCTIKDIYSANGRMHYASPASFKGNLLKALIDFEPWCKVDMNTKPYRLFIAGEETP